MPRIRQQLRDNLVALVSLLVTFSTLSYSAWRHDVTEDNRTLREVAFVLLRTAEKLQSVVDFTHYNGDHESGNPIKGWGKALYLRDLGVMLTADVADCGRPGSETGKRWTSMRPPPSASPAVVKPCVATCGRCGSTCCNQPG